MVLALAAVCCLTECFLVPQLIVFSSVVRELVSVCALIALSATVLAIWRLRGRVEELSAAKCRRNRRAETNAKFRWSHVQAARYGG